MCRGRGIHRHAPCGRVPPRLCGSCGDSAMRLAVVTISSAMALFFVLNLRGAEADGCRQSEIDLPITFRFADPDVREVWVYRSLSPRLRVGKSTVAPSAQEVVNSSLQLTFCVPERDAQSPSIAAIGPSEL